MSTKLIPVEIEEADDGADGRVSAPMVRGGVMDNVEIVDEDDWPGPVAAPSHSKKSKHKKGGKKGAGRDDMFDMLANPKKTKSVFAPPPVQPAQPDSGFEFDEYDDFDGYGDEGGFEGDDMHYGEDVVDDEACVMPRKSPQEIHAEKMDILHKLHRYKEKGFSVPNFDMRADIDEMRFEYDKVARSIETKNAINTMRQMLVATTSAFQFFNTRYDPIGLKLDGWSESILANVTDYDGVFERLYDKHRHRVSMPPEMELMLMLGGSAMMFHMSASFASSGLPSMSEIAKTDPELMKSIVKMMISKQEAAAAPPSAPPPPQQAAREPSDSNGGGYVMRGPVLYRPDVSPPVNMDRVVQEAMPPTPPRGGVVNVIDDGGESAYDDASVQGDDIRTVQMDTAKKRQRKRGGGKKAAAAVDPTKVVMDL